MQKDAKMQIFTALSFGEGWGEVPDFNERTKEINENKDYLLIWKKSKYIISSQISQLFPQPSKNKLPTANRKRQF